MKPGRYLAAELNLHHRISWHQLATCNCSAWKQSVGSVPMQHLIKCHSKFMIVFTQIGSPPVVDQGNGSDLFSEPVEPELFQQNLIVKFLRQQRRRKVISIEVSRRLRNQGSMFEHPVIETTFFFQKNWRVKLRLAGIGSNAEFRTMLQAIYLVVESCIKGIVKIQAAHEVSIIF